MNIITLGAMAGHSFSTAKFDSLTFSENGLLLKYRNEKEVEISFDELDKVYIKKYKLNPFVEFLGIAFPFLFVYITLQYLPFYLMILVSLITVVPVFIGVLNYKWYQLNVLLKDGTSFRKKIAKDKKTENFSILEKIRTEYICYNYYDSTLATT